MSASESSSEDESIVPAVLLRETRATRGKRMTTLVGKAAEDDETFWGGGSELTFDDSDDDSFVAEDDRPDEFDSDFNESEDEIDEEEEDERPRKRVSKKDDSEKSKKKAVNKFHEPQMSTATKRLAAAAAAAKRVQEGGAPIPKKRRMVDPLAASAEAAALPRSRRESTVAKSAGVADELARRQKVVRIREPVKRMKYTFTQDQMLEDALDTEDVNFKWTQARKWQSKMIEEDDSKKPRATRATVDFIRTHSKRGSLLTVTFSNSELMPDILRPVPSLDSAKQAAAEKRLCVVTGLPAKYRDPLTGHPYANLEAFRELRRRAAEKPKSAPQVGASGAKSSSHKSTYT